MSWCRLSHSDLYVFESTEGGYVCMACPLAEKGPTGWNLDTRCESASEMSAHVLTHHAAGHDVPEWLVEMLQRGETP